MKLVPQAGLPLETLDGAAGLKGKGGLTAREKFRHDSRPACFDALSQFCASTSRYAAFGVGG